MIPISHRINDFLHVSLNWWITEILYNELLRAFINSLQYLDTGQMKGEGMIKTSQWGKRSKRVWCSRTKGRRCFKEGVIGSATYCAWVQDDEDGELSVGLAPGLWEPVVRVRPGPNTDCSGMERMGEVDIGHRQLRVLPFVYLCLYTQYKQVN